MDSEVEHGQSEKKSLKPGLVKNLWGHKELYLMMLPGILYLLINNYLPIGGLSLAFKKYDYSKGILGSPWNGLSNFKFLFSTKDAGMIIRNTLGYNFIFILLGTVFAIIVAIILNEIGLSCRRRFTRSLF